MENIEDLLGNIIKNKQNTTNTNQKSYSPDIDESDLVLLIKNKLYPLSPGLPDLDLLRKQFCL